MLRHTENFDFYTDNWRKKKVYGNCVFYTEKVKKLKIINNQNKIIMVSNRFDIDLETDELTLKIRELMSKKKSERIKKEDDKLQIHFIIQLCLYLLTMWSWKWFMLASRRITMLRSKS